MKIIRTIIKFFRRLWILFCNWVVRGLLKMRSRLRMQSLRGAIQEADKIKADTGKKAIVLFNHGAGKYEPVTKQDLKKAYRQGKSARKKGKKSPFTLERIKRLEKRSMYVN